MSKPINVIDTISAACGRDGSNKTLLVFLGLLRVAVLLSTGLKIVGLLPLPTLSKNHLMFLVIRIVHKGQIPPRGRKCMRLTKVTLFLYLVMFIVCGSVQEVFF